jgi:hypothetical protein
MLDWIENENQIKPANIHFPDQSVNRERFSRPKDVLLPDGSERSKSWILCGVASFRVADLPGDMQSPGGVSFRFTVEHDPNEDNYSHSELRVYKNGQRERDKRRINDTIKKAYRTKLALSTRVIVTPLI